MLLDDSKPIIICHIMNTMVPSLIHPAIAAPHTVASQTNLMLGAVNIGVPILMVPLLILCMELRAGSKAMVQWQRSGKESPRGKTRIVWVSNLIAKAPHMK